MAILTGDEYFSLYESEVPYLTRTAVFALYGVTDTNWYSGDIFGACAAKRLKLFGDLLQIIFGYSRKFDGVTFYSF